MRKCVAVVVLLLFAGFASMERARPRSLRAPIQTPSRSARELAARELAEGHDTLPDTPGTRRCAAIDWRPYESVVRAPA